MFIYKVLFEPQTLLFCSAGILTRTALLGVTSTKAQRSCGTTVPYPNVQKVKTITRSKEHAGSCVSIKTIKRLFIRVCFEQIGPKSACWAQVSPTEAQSPSLKVALSVCRGTLLLSNVK